MSYTKISFITLREFIKKQICYIAIVLFLPIAGSLAAERRLYQYNGPAGEFVPKFIDTMTGDGFKFSVKSVYNEKNDGKQGFVIILKPSGAFCEVTFTEKGKISIISFFSQNSSDMANINSLLLLKMKMVEIGESSKEGSKVVPRTGGSGWPDPGVR
jgi:hypothetical protein